MNIITVFFARLKTNPNFVKYGLPSIIVVPLLADIITGVFDVVLGINLPFSALIRALILFFGLLSVVGSYFLYTKNINFKIFLPAISIGLLSTAVLNLNNMRDQIEDKKNNKNTLVVKLGSQKAKMYHFSLIIGALIAAIIYVQLNYYAPTQYLFLIAFIPLGLNLVVVAKNILFSELDKELKKVALSTFLFAILFGIGQIF